LQQSTYINYHYYTYGNWMYSVTDELGKKKEYYNDAYNNLINIAEHISTTTATTTYTYDGSGNLTKITDALGNVRNYTYDLLSRILKNEDLHNASDTSFGSTTYAYDDNGNITQSVNPRGKVTNYTYDALNRVKTEDTPDTAYTDVSYTYDNSLHAGKGRLGNVSTPYVGTGYDYDWNGNLLAEQHLIPGSATTTTWYYYDRQQNPTYIIYPDNSEVYYGYNSAGLLNLVYQINSGDPGWTVMVSNFDYSPMDKVTLTQYGNGTVSLNTYVPTNLYWLGSRVAYNASKYFQYQVYGHDNEGNVTSSQEAANVNSAKIVNYTYDDLYRLTIASTTGAVNGQNFRQTFAYNELGNIVNNSGTNYLYQGNSGTNYANPHAPTTIGSNTNTYDQSGNLLTTGSSTNSWDYKDRLTQTIFTNGTTTATTTYTYDQAGNRLTKTVGSITTFYPNKYYTTNSAGIVDKYVFANGQLLGTVENMSTTTNRYWSYQDPLGGTDVVANSLGNPIELIDYYPFGSLRLDEASSTYNDQRKYIGEYYDPSSSMSYLNARYYYGGRGQFISEDPVFLDNPMNQDLMNPQNLNSYSYSINNPITYSDPSGRCIGPALPVCVAALVDVAEIALDAYSYYSLGNDFKNLGDSFATPDSAAKRDHNFAQLLGDGGLQIAEQQLLRKEKLLSSGLSAGLDTFGNLVQKYAPSGGSGSSGSSRGNSSGGVSVNGTSNSSTKAINTSSNGNAAQQQTNNQNSNNGSSKNNTTIIVTTTVKTTVTVIGNRIITTTTTTTTVTTRRN
jgi:RHS repeat-associated protein